MLVSISVSCEMTRVGSNTCAFVSVSTKSADKRYLRKKNFMMVSREGLCVGCEKQCNRESELYVLEPVKGL